jgi:Manganese containing catalase
MRRPAYYQSRPEPRSEEVQQPHRGFCATNWHTTIPQSGRAEGNPEGPSEQREELNPDWKKTKACSHDTAPKQDFFNVWKLSFHTRSRGLMYHHIKKLMYTVNVGAPDPRFGNTLLEQFGGANGELAAAMQYSIQGLNCDDPDRKDLLMDIGTEELSHLEVVGTLARMHLKPLKTRRDAAEDDPLIAIAGGGGGAGPGLPPNVGRLVSSSAK